MNKHCFASETLIAFVNKFPGYLIHNVPMIVFANYYPVINVLLLPRPDYSDDSLRKKYSYESPNKYFSVSTKLVAFCR